MMKMIIPLILMSTPSFLSNPQLTIIILSTLIILLPITLFQQSITISSSMFTMHDNYSSILILLTLMSTNLIFLSNHNLNSIKKTIPYILIFLILTFLSSNSITFYIAFELTLIPTFMLILSKGKQPERLQAGFYLLLYTVTSSLPFLIFISNSLNSQSIPLLYVKCSTINSFWIVMLAFLIKMPMFLTHLWLPKAHVEAPLEGSMILAAVLLKMGGYGIIRFLPLIINNMNKLNHWLISISLIGALSTSMNCIRQKDLKSLIAYSSVSHMAFAIISLTSMNSSGMSGAMLMMISHGLTSSALFFLINTIYYKSHTRNTLMFKGMLMIFPNLSLWWFIFMSLNISAPPSINTTSEILIISSTMQWNYMSFLILSPSILAIAMFSMNLFLNISHNSSFLNKYHPNQNSKTFLSLFIHLLPLITMLTKMETMTEL